MNIFKVEVVSKTQLTPKIYELKLKILEPQGFSFKAGQCVGFVVAEEHKRLYSITSLPEDSKQLSFCVDVSPMGPTSQFVIAAQPGQQFEIEGPYGAFTVNSMDNDLLFVATGAGVAPFKSIIADLLAKGFNKKITLLFGVRQEEDIFYHDFFKTLASQHANFEFLPGLSQPKGEWPGVIGRWTKYLTENYQRYAGRLAYICGATEMIKDTRALLLANGWPVKAVKIEIFV